MKKQIPKFDQKAWDEKQAKSADNYSKNDGGGFPGVINFVPYDSAPVAASPFFGKPTRQSQAQGILDYQKAINELAEKIKKDQEQLGNNKLICTTKIYPWTNYTPAGVYTIGDDYDQKLFGGDSEDTMQLPKGYYDQTGFDWASTGASNPAKTNCDLGIHSPINVGFHHDVFVCKHCDKELNKSD